MSGLSELFIVVNSLSPTVETKSHRHPRGDGGGEFRECYLFLKWHRQDGRPVTVQSGVQENKHCTSVLLC